MVTFDYTGNEYFQRLDWKILREGFTSFFLEKEALEEARTWFREQLYQEYYFDCSQWVSDETFHESVSTTLGFPDYYGRNISAFNDCMAELDIPLSSGCLLICSEFDLFAKQFPTFAKDILDILIHQSHLSMLGGLRLITLIHSNDQEFSMPPLGCQHLVLNPIEKHKRSLKS